MDKEEKFYKTLITAKDKKTVVGEMMLNDSNTLVFVALNKDDGILKMEASPSNVSFVKVLDGGSIIKEKHLEEEFKKGLGENVEDIVKISCDELSESSKTRNFALPLLAAIPLLKWALGGLALAVASAIGITVIRKSADGAFKDFFKDISTGVRGLFKTNIGGGVSVGMASVVLGGVFLSSMVADMYNEMENQKISRKERELMNDIVRKRFEKEINETMDEADDEYKEDGDSDKEDVKQIEG